MPFLWVEADDEPARDSIRAYIEQNVIALVSCSGPSQSVADPPSMTWLGRHCRSERVKRSGLWNAEYTEETYDPAFLDVLFECAETTKVECQSR